MKSGLGLAIAVVILLVAAPSWAQSLTPIQGWVPFDSPKAKALMHDDPTTPAHQAGLTSHGIDR
ncbi:MAG TPA: hypothetical protein VFQ90_20730 [Stellaceae bacterium]|jgi:hypothetical protein|nr:hypothetical protein [Stellaceae bacterium]